jgi:hypothetical protein
VLFKRWGRVQDSVVQIESRQPVVAVQMMDGIREESVSRRPRDDRVKCGIAGSELRESGIDLSRRCHPHQSFGALELDEFVIGASFGSLPSRERLVLKSNVVAVVERAFCRRRFRSEAPVLAFEN